MPLYPRFTCCQSSRAVVCTKGVLVPPPFHPRVEMEATRSYQKKEIREVHMALSSAAMCESRIIHVISQEIGLPRAYPLLRRPCIPAASSLIDLADESLHSQAIASLFEPPASPLCQQAPPSTTSTCRQPAKSFQGTQSPSRPCEDIFGHTLRGIGFLAADSATSTQRKGRRLAAAVGIHGRHAASSSQQIHPS